MVIASAKIAVLEKKPEQPVGPETSAPVQVNPSSDLPMMVPLSVAELRRLFFHLVDKPFLSFAYRPAWSGWRPAHQALARLYHYKRRCALASHLQL